MRRLWLALLVLVCLMLAGSTTSALAGDSSLSTATSCTIQLRVDVFGGPVSWARAAGLTTGHAATLRAVAHGCAGLDHMTGRYVGRPSAAPLSHACGGAVCTWRVQSAGMQAVDFQAFGNSPAGSRVRSNVVRVAWAGGDSVAGAWTWRFAQPGQPLATHGTVDFDSDHTMSWSGGGGGK